MARANPLSRLIDSSLEQSGPSAGRRYVLLMVLGIWLANAVGALVVFVLAGWAMPIPDLEDTGAVQQANLIALALYLGGALIVGSVIGIRIGVAAGDWVRKGRDPSEEEQRGALRLPWRLLWVNATLWSLAAVVFAALNALWSIELGVEVGLVVLLGGLSTSAASFLIAERVNRPLAARALGYGVPSKPVLPGVVSRFLFAWALGAGIPLLSLTGVAIVSFFNEGISDTELALTIVGLGATGLAVGLLMTWQSSQAVADPVASLREGLAEIEKGNLDTEIEVFDGSELGLLQAGFNRMASGLRERERLADLFGRHVGEEVARAALESDVELGGEEREVAVLFVDLAGSTKLAVEREPHQVVDLLNEFFQQVVELVEEHGGWINKFEGDGALAIFGAPIEREDSAGSALAAARELGERLASSLDGHSAGIGVSAGTVVAGNVGAERRFEYTVIGDPVNEAARLCDLAKSRPEKVLASASTLELAGEDEARRWTRGESVELRGRGTPTQLATPA